MHLHNGSPFRSAARQRHLFALLALTLLLEPQGCRQGCDTTTTVTAPSMAFIAPMTAQAGGSGFTLQVTGNMENGVATFTVNSVVRWNGSDRPTRFIDGLNLEASIPSTDIAAPGNARVTVFNPGRELQDTGECILRWLRAESSPITFSITPPPAPAMLPAAAVADSLLPSADTLASLGLAHRPLLALDDRGNIYLIAEQQLSGRTAVLFARSADRGRSFSAPADLASSPSLLAMPDAAFEGASKLFVLWRHKSEADPAPEPGATAAESVGLLMLSLQVIDRQQGLDWRRDPKSQLVLDALSALAVADSPGANRSLNSLGDEVAAPQSAPVTDQQAGYLRSLARFAVSLVSPAARQP